MSTIRLRAVGDDLLHWQLNAAAKRPDGSRDFAPMFAHIAPLMQEAELAVINQETILVEDERRISSFPVFGSPTAVAEAIAAAGFNVVTHASNHALDKGFSAICETVRCWQRFAGQVEYAGIHADRADRDRIRVIGKNGIRVALLNYTQTLNFHPLPPAHPYCVDVMKPYAKGRIRHQLRLARQQADVVIVFPHWGCEYLFEPVKRQRAWAQFFADAGADLIIGTHPHVLQSTETLRTNDGRSVPCLYSLGNFISCQISQATMLGGMADVVIEKTGEGTRITQAEIQPLVTHAAGEFEAFTVYPLADYTDALAAQNKILTEEAKYAGFSYDTAYLRKLFEDILSHRAMAYCMYKSPGEVRKGNLIGTIHAITRRLKKHRG